ncbi:hypothetical protein GCM10014719_27530 [Planomonospora parontospora subsp. antibiotica]|nr:hypothetical protein GCM10014719_27530 [Planomonospora parontospora subsp. antibiotica]GII15115.1 hypothetical protein Ppa05_18410 [Planomonospora parontospora subsp. antibiotica]
MTPTAGRPTSTASTTLTILRVLGLRTAPVAAVPYPNALENNRAADDTVLWTYLIGVLMSR